MESNLSRKSGRFGKVFWSVSMAWLAWRSDYCLGSHMKNGMICEICGYSNTLRNTPYRDHFFTKSFGGDPLIDMICGNAGQMKQLHCN
jgi:hypothetical protein